MIEAASAYGRGGGAYAKAMIARTKRPKSRLIYGGRLLKKLWPVVVRWSTGAIRRKRKEEMPDSSFAETRQGGKLPCDLDLPCCTFWKARLTDLWLTERK